MATSSTCMTPACHKHHDMVISSPTNALLSRLCVGKASPFKNFEFGQARHRCSPIRGMNIRLSPVSVTSLFGNQGSLAHTIPLLPWQLRPRRRRFIPQASIFAPWSFRYPPMTKKPRWWWRTLSCLPYLMPLHETWMYAEAVYHLHPFLENFEFLAYPFLSTISMLPSWFLMAYFFAAYLGVVRKRQWPHFLRYHVVMSMLLEIALQVISSICRWLPPSVYSGKTGMYFGAAVAFAYVFTVLECMRCALAGMYADVPFVSDAAYIQIPFD